MRYFMPHKLSDEQVNVPLQKVGSLREFLLGLWDHMLAEISISIMTARKLCALLRPHSTVAFDTSPAKPSC